MYAPMYYWGFLMAANSDKIFMQLALELAANGRGKTSPNPMVGAVLVKNNRIIGQGYHKKAGTPHAEINALKKAGSAARGATLYVTLEPCCHYGRTKPCSVEIIKSGIKRVVFAMKDPNPIVGGKGARQLRQAGLEVKSGILRNEAEKLNEAYIKFITTGHPFVILKTAQTIDGRIASITGDSKWVTGPRSRKMGHQLRAECDAVVVGAGTVRADNPELTVRLTRGKNPYRIILSGSLDFPRSIKLFKNNKDSRTIVATSAYAARDLKIKNMITWEIKKEKSQLSLSDFLKKAGDFGITSLLVEGGSQLATAFLRKRLVDKHYIFMAPRIIGTGFEAVGNLGLKKMADSMNYHDLSIDTSCEPDILLVGYPERNK